MLCTFTIGFQKVLRVVVQFAWFFPVQLTLFYTDASLKVLPLIIYDPATKVLNTESFIQDKIADLTFSIIFIVLFSQEKALR